MLLSALVAPGSACTLVRDWSDLRGKASVCGDGVIDPGEQCDDGNTVEGDECSAQCKVVCDCKPPDICFAIPHTSSCYRLAGLSAGNKQTDATVACQKWCGDPRRCDLATIGDA